MINLRYSISIPTTAENVWRTLTSKRLYPLWAKAFSEGQQYEGEFIEGEIICFFDPKIGGVEVSVQKMIPHRRILLKHRALFDKNLKRDCQSKGAKEWEGAQEDYFLKEEYGLTRLEVELFVPERYERFFERSWPKALESLKNIALSLGLPEERL